MELIITDKAQALLRGKLENITLYLDFIDGDSPGYEGAISCAIGVSFRLLLVKKPADYPVLEKFDGVFSTRIGEVKVKTSSNMYFEEKMTLDFNENYQRLQLTGNSGIIDNNVPVEEM